MAFQKTYRVVLPGRRDRQAHLAEDGAEVRICWLPSRGQEPAEGIMPCKWGTVPTLLPVWRQPQGFGAKRPGRGLSLIDRYWWRSPGQAAGLEELGGPGSGLCLQHTTGSHTHARGRWLSNQPLESGFIVFCFYSPPFDLVFSSQSCSFRSVSYSSDRVVPSQTTKGWTPLAIM